MKQWTSLLVASTYWCLVVLSGNSGSPVPSTLNLCKSEKISNCVVMQSTVHPGYTVTFWTKLYFGNKRRWQYSKGEFRYKYKIFLNLDSEFWVTEKKRSWSTIGWSPTINCTLNRIEFWVKLISKIVPMTDNRWSFILSYQNTCLFQTKWLVIPGVVFLDRFHFSWYFRIQTK